MDILQYLLTGAILGLVAGISPGPILALVIKESLQNGRKAGMKVATVPLVSDLPIVLLTLIILTKVAEYDAILGIISFLGAGFILLLAYESLRVKAVQGNLKPPKISSFSKGVLANLLSPHPYLFWLLVGSPMVLKAWNITPWAGISFVLGFYLCIVGAKLIIAWISDKSKNVLGTTGYIWVIRILGIILIVLAIYLIMDGINFLT
ncbi:MAG: LysE family translocator [Bacteroidetes bacterium]|jgi:threonine/homoserine/homoserine lactone efflux protein|nr:LysE family translocator [Bacteroidota bacterium]MBT3751241.1 LysE family translocator [Bacteroidota bacterium]MBT4397943.1 LysE family translocator [Bacteroidota bacterium]MBT4409137.1 LysE family translocator [Bacteroidota bacterium]MBT7093256.1 LysE family translocator [Bacteroidota bacterium]